MCVLLQKPLLFYTFSVALHQKHPQKNVTSNLDAKSVESVLEVYPK